ncbi:hypothetical protein G3O07_04960 [Pseudomonas laurentiana]|uniref:Type 4 fimbrial biogenesis protein PilX N-terminal domain-containing protein n=1 Tax=Pseudomonas laurentiana TaxID=2364649 RepID=A0A6I5RM78_9PSED|nr:hypothetical protein [Pseudomonas laurentiana]
MSTQRGMVLLLSLLLTMLLGLLGLSSLHSALLQERMSGNLLVSLQLLEQAETTLRHAEAQLQAGLELAPCRYCQPPPEAGNVQAPGIYRGAEGIRGWFGRLGLGPVSDSTTRAQRPCSPDACGRAGHAVSHHRRCPPGRRSYSAGKHLCLNAGG